MDPTLCSQGRVHRRWRASPCKWHHWSCSLASATSQAFSGSLTSAKQCLLPVYKCLHLPCPSLLYVCVQSSLILESWEKWQLFLSLQCLMLPSLTVHCHSFCIPHISCYQPIWPWQARVSAGWQRLFLSAHHRCCSGAFESWRKSSSSPWIAPRFSSSVQGKESNPLSYRATRKTPISLAWQTGLKWYVQHAAPCLSVLWSDKVLITIIFLSCQIVSSVSWLNTRGWQFLCKSYWFENALKDFCYSHMINMINNITIW